MSMNSVEFPTDKELALRVSPLPSDANMHGDIFGGWVMAQVDIAGAVPATRLARGRIATISVNHFVFKHPVSVGDLVSFFAKVVRHGRSSITVDVEVFAEKRFRGQVTRVENAERSQIVRVTEAQLTYVAVDANGRPRHLNAP